MVTVLQRTLRQTGIVNHFHLTQMNGSACSHPMSSHANFSVGTARTQSPLGRNIPLGSPGAQLVNVVNKSGGDAQKKIVDTPE